MNNLVECTHILSIESQKGAINIQRCSIENQKGILALQVYNVYGDSALLVLSRISLKSVNALLAFTQRYHQWEPEGHYHYSKLFRWELEGRYHHRHCTTIAPFWFSMEHLWILIMPFWLSTDNIEIFFNFSESCIGLRWCHCMYFSYMLIEAQHGTGILFPQIFQTYIAKRAVYEA